MSSFEEGFDQNEPFSEELLCVECCLEQIEKMKAIEDETKIIAEAIREEEEKANHFKCEICLDDECKLDCDLELV